jgi:hypothetical protein
MSTNVCILSDEESAGASTPITLFFFHKKFAQHSFVQNAVIIPFNPCGGQEITVYLLI